ncbi:hypothetical protein T484DRAFT_1920661, partial [Baffinella frigidus]
MATTMAGEGEREGGREGGQEEVSGVVDCLMPEGEHEGEREGGEGVLGAVERDIPELTPSDWHKPFVDPPEKHLVNVPNTFKSTAHYCKVIGHNLLAEHWHVVNEAKPSAEFSCVSATSTDPKGNVYVNVLKIAPKPDGTSPELEDGYMLHLLFINNTRYMVTDCEFQEDDPLKLPILTVRPNLKMGAGQRCLVRSLGYFGTQVAEFRALSALSEDTSEPSPVFASILNPKVNTAGEYLNAPIRKHLQPINTSQLQ